MHLSELQGRRVVSRATAEALGDVTDLRLSGHPATVSAMQIGKGRKAQGISWSQIVGIGPDAVVIQSDDAASDEDLGESPMGRLVLSELGNAAGPVTDVEFDESTGALISLATKAALVEGDRLLVIGPYAIIIAARPTAKFPG